ncbi:MFS general substrate transporter [Mytilinidion resinicola]|uniref:MFS general substrate transporter n=1 Tax=Mytilinidion resinicola TaxID=574789 RepID=A0A6A6Z7X5_9PEZI|nr:MFS general substrate transporter [Mytilinidion resinicola]KAF2816317.1 MFS general substrate transporter [Mytilinidion resinicola]
MSHDSPLPATARSSLFEKPDVQIINVVDEELVVEKPPPGHIAEDDLSDEQKKEEARAIRKVDWRLIPILGGLYSIAGLDRVNLSNARVAGMNEDLHFDVGNRYSIALLVFFVTYFLFELPSTLTLRPIGPKIQLNALAFSWGAVMLGMGFANDWRVIVVCRILIGIFEAGFLPCCMFLLSTWYQRYEIQQRMALWYLINLFVSAFGNILAFALVKLDGSYGIVGWRWIFIIEGVATIGFSLVGYFLVVGFPDVLLASNDRRAFTTAELLTVLNRVYGFMFMTSSAPIYAFAYFIQTILKTMGYTTAIVFLLCAPPYLVSILWTVGNAWIADRTRLRMPWMVLNAVITLTGLLLTAYCTNNGSNNVRSDSRRSMASGIQFVFAAIGGIYASTTFMQKEYPSYRTGVWCAVATQGLLVVLVGVMTWHFRVVNGKADSEGYVSQEERFRHTF